MVYSTSDGTATVANNDYVPTSGTLTFAAGAQTPLTQLVTVLINGDTAIEPNETFNLVLSSPTNATVGGDPGVATILNDDGAHIAFSAVPSQNEGNSGTTPFVFTVTIGTVDPLQTITVAYTTADGSATAADGDYVATSGTLTFLPNELTHDITVLVNGDTTFETDETFQVLLSNPTNATLDQASGTGTILNDDAAPTVGLSSTTISQNEGNSGTTPFLFTVNLSAASGTATTVQFATSDGTATTADSDYQATSGTLTIAPGATSAVITVLVNGDTKNELDETFSLTLSSPSQATLGAITATTATILNDDPVPTLSIGNVSQNEGNSGTTNFVFTVSLSAASGQTVTVAYSTADGTATTADSDYAATSGTLTFTPGQTSQTLTVAVNGDTKFESNETFSVNLSTPTNATLAATSATGTIVNDDPAPTLVVTPVSQNEGNTGTTPFVFSVSLSNASSQNVTVSFSTADGTATVANNDYQATSGTITFIAGQTGPQLITVNVVGDTLNEANETFKVNLTPTDTSLAASSVTGTILNDDPLPAVTIAGVSGTKPDSGLTPFVFTVTMSAASGQAVTVPYTTADNTATVANNNYQATSGTLTFTPAPRRRPSPCRSSAIRSRIPTSSSTSTY